MTNKQTATNKQQDLSEKEGDPLLSVSHRYGEEKRMRKERSHREQSTAKLIRLCERINCRLTQAS